MITVATALEEVVSPLWGVAQAVVNSEARNIAYGFGQAALDHYGHRAINKVKDYGEYKVVEYADDLRGKLSKYMNQATKGNNTLTAGSGNNFITPVKKSRPASGSELTVHGETPKNRTRITPVKKQPRLRSSPVVVGGGRRYIPSGYYAYKQMRKRTYKRRRY